MGRQDTTELQFYNLTAATLLASATISQRLLQFYNLTAAADKTWNFLFAIDTIRNLTNLFRSTHLDVEKIEQPGMFLALMAY